MVAAKKTKECQVINVVLMIRQMTMKINEEKALHLRQNEELSVTAEDEKNHSHQQKNYPCQ